MQFLVFSKIFVFRVDTDQDQKLSFSEIESWITDKIQEHFDEALEENAHVFKHLDPDGNGIVYLSCGLMFQSAICQPS